MREKITWTRDPCGSGPTCPKVGPRSSTGTVLAVGTIVTDPALIEQAGIGPGEALVELPGELLPEV